MLVLKRKLGERLYVGGETVTVRRGEDGLVYLDTGAGSFVLSFDRPVQVGRTRISMLNEESCVVRLGFDGPDAVWRSEVMDRKRAERRETDAGAENQA